MVPISEQIQTSKSKTTLKILSRSNSPQFTLILRRLLPPPKNNHTRPPTPKLLNNPHKITLRKLLKTAKPNLPTAKLQKPDPNKNKISSNLLEIVHILQYYPEYVCGWGAFVGLGDL